MALGMIARQQGRGLAETAAEAKSHEVSGSGLKATYDYPYLWQAYYNLILYNKVFRICLENCVKHNYKTDILDTYWRKAI